MGSTGAPERDGTLARMECRDVLAALPHAGPLARLYARARYAICPFDEVARAVPERGRILDVGCGYGLFSIHLRLQSPKRRILGIDRDVGRIATASRSSLVGAGVEFAVGDIADTKLEACEAVVMIDVLHHLPDPVAHAVLREAKRQLEPDGVLVLKDLDTRPLGRHLWNWTHDAVVTRSFDIYVRPRARVEAALVRAGFRRVRSCPLPTRAPYAHVLFTAR